MLKTTGVFFLFIPTLNLLVMMIFTTRLKVHSSNNLAIFLINWALIILNMYRRLFCFVLFFSCTPQWSLFGNREYLLWTYSRELTVELLEHLSDLLQSVDWPKHISKTCRHRSYCLFKINLLHIKTGQLVGSSVAHNLFEKRKTWHLKLKKKHQTIETFILSR